MSFICSINIVFAAKAVAALKTVLAEEERARPAPAQDAPMTAVEFIRQGLQLQERQYAFPYASKDGCN
jgi:DNA-binding transcriptional regulator YiaG